MQDLTSNKPSRISSIDLLRGLIMIIMALDHTRDFFHTGALSGDPLDPRTTYPALYATRWITHLCAPTFVFLSGLSAWLQLQRKTKKELCLFLITRGLWLIIVDLTIMSFAFSADVHFNFLILETLWSIGAGMIILGGMIWLPFPVILTTGLLIVFGHNLLDFAERDRGGVVPLWWSFLHRVTVTPLPGGRNLFILYPFLSWAGLMMLGYCAGSLFTRKTIAVRNRILLLTGVAAILVFVVLRYSNLYGDPAPWSKQETTQQTIFSFLNVQKYPPSLLFLCATIGTVLIILALLQKARGKWVQVVSVYGRVPLFFFVVHFFPQLCP